MMCSNFQRQGDRHMNCNKNFNLKTFEHGRKEGLLYGNPTGVDI